MCSTGEQTCNKLVNTTQKLLNEITRVAHDNDNCSNHSNTNINELSNDALKLIEELTNLIENPDDIIDTNNKNNEIISDNSKELILSLRKYKFVIKRRFGISLFIL